MTRRLDVGAALAGHVSDILLFDSHDDGEIIDIEVRLVDSSRWGATLVTLRGIENAMMRWSESGECAHGQFFWVGHPLVVNVIEDAIVTTSVEWLLENAEFSSALERLADDEPIQAEGRRTEHVLAADIAGECSQRTPQSRPR